MELIDSVTNIPPHGSRIIALRSNFLRAFMENVRKIGETMSDATRAADGS